ncbi:MAG: hypothetical protein M3N14_09320 [Bacteroidota bacterium]|nr:hypothetical protein [Bacteroidota bacterium]
MGKRHIECPVCGSQYFINSQKIEKIDKGVIHCYVCDNVLIEYDGCASYYPFLITQKHLKDIEQFGGLTTDGFADIVD